MPITRSKGKNAEAWIVDLGDGPSTSTPAITQPPRTPITDSAELPCPPSPIQAPLLTPSSTEFPVSPCDQRGMIIQKGDAANKLQLTQTVRRATSATSRPVESVKSRKTDRSRRKLDAREEYLRIKLELARLAIQKAESQDSEYDEEGPSKEDYVRSWIEEIPDSTSQPDDDFATKEDFEIQQSGNLPPPRLVDINAQKEQQLKLSLKENKFPLKIEDAKCQVKNEYSNSADALRPFITELTSAIATLAETKSQVNASPHPSVSKVIMTLPTFNGSHTEWLSFKAIYDTTRVYFNDVENTARLRRSLQGRALEAVSSELIGHAKPDDIMSELELQFGRPDSIAQAELDRLRALPRCSEAPKDICTFASRVRNSVVTLRALKRDHYLINAELLRCLTDKLPSSLRIQWYKAYTEEYHSMPDLGHFSKFVTEHARFCSAFAPPETVTDTNRRLVHKTHTATERQTPKCKVCEKDGHFASDCKKFVQADSNEKWNLAKKHGLCFRCLRSRYRGHSCKSRKCGKEGCTATHHSLLHYTKRNRDSETENNLKETVASSCTLRKNQAFLKIVPVTVIGPAGEITTYAQLDDGSTISLMDEEIAEKVGAKGKLYPLKIKSIGNVSIDMPDSRKIDVSLVNRDSKRVPFTARTVPRLHLSPQTVSTEDITECKHLQDIKDKLTYETGTPKVLIGQDNWNLLLAKTVRRGPNNQPIASLTELGWVLHGAHTRGALGQSINFINQLANDDRNTEIEDQLKEYFALESLIINPRRPDSDPEKKAEDILNKHTRQLENGHIETALLWKQDNVEMPDNYDTALKRLLSIEKKLDRNPELKIKYTDQMDSLVQKGYAEVAPNNSTPGRTWYLPHFDVHNAMKPDKLRIVHDAAAKTKGVSLNDFLLTGPDLLKSLPGVMMRFRRHRVAVSADIAEMFMQVKVRPEDRDALRYLWRESRRDGAPKEYRMKSIIFGAASSPCTAIFAKNWNAKNYSNIHPKAAEAIIQNHYMDDYLDSFETEEEAAETSKAVRQIHKAAHFDLRKWVSNSTEVMKELEPNREPTDTVNLTYKSTEEKILGLIWTPTTDELSFNLKLARLPTNLLEKELPTKREALRIIMSLYDPLGLASPITVQAKQILQEAWRRGTNWDQSLDKDLAKQWVSWLRHMENLKTVKIPRCYTGYSNAVSLQVHIFTDASETVFAAAAYWRTITSDGKIHVNLIMAKAKVAPLKVTSIPRLELQAAVIGSRIATAVVQEHHVKPESITYWTDSRTVLTWLKKGSRSYKPFVAHRLAAIEEHSKVEDWRWVPTKLNIADVATRDVPSDFNANHAWFRGPSFLYEDPIFWPTEKTIITEHTGEERTTTVKEFDNSPKYDEIIPIPTRFSRWERLLRATARTLQFIALCRKSKADIFYKRTCKNIEEDSDWKKAKKIIKPIKKVTPQANSDSTRKYIPLDAEFIKKAEIILIHVIQLQSFKQEIINLREGKPIDKDSRLRVLPVELKNNIITLRSRIAAVQGITEETKSPPVLDGDHYITQLYIDWTHRSLHHSGTEPTINEVRQYYWVIRLRPTTKKIVSHCLICRIRKAKPPVPPTGDHPRSRLAHHQRPFTYTGLDYFGPLSVTVGRQQRKRYVALFTCLTTRAVHLEVVENLSADSAILAIRRFAARRGCPTEIYSDNGTNMHGADKELREASREEANRRGIVWRFITPSAPFMGGAWERLVRCVKNTLYTVLKQKHPHEEVLTTLLCEAEYTVNSRPLTHVSTDSDDNEAITPNHFLLGGSARLPTPGSFDEKDLGSKKHWRRSQILADMFWRRWVLEYLPELQHRREPNGRGINFQVGDLVLIADNQLPRNTWPRGKIVAVYPGTDGHVRTVEVRTAGGILKRPTKKLVPLPK